MVRLATPADIPRILDLREAARETPLVDPGAITAADMERFVAAGALWVWQGAGEPLAGLAACDVGQGAVWALLVAPGQEGRGIGRALLQAACDGLRAAGHGSAWLRVQPGSIAERHFRRAGWVASGVAANREVIFRKGL